MGTVLAILLGIFLFGLIIFVHELGHFLTARLFGVGVTEFAMGMGPKIFSRKGKDDIVYSLRLFPIGGFVSMIGEDEEAPEGMEDKALCRKKPWQRFIIIAAGATMNLIMGFIVMFIVVLSSKDLYSTTIQMFNVVDQANNRVESYQGLLVGDEIVKVGNKNIFVRSDFVYEAMFLQGEPTDLTVLRDGKRVVISDFKFPTQSEQNITFGNPNFFYPEKLDKDFGVVIKETIGQSVSTINVIWKSLIALVSGKFGMNAVSGPVGVVGQIEETAAMGAESVMFLLVLLSMNVGVFNLLPIPALDGGRLFFIIVEMIRRKPINPKYEGAIHFAGLVVLLGFMAFVTFNDILRLFK